MTTVINNLVELNLVDRKTPIDISPIVSLSYQNPESIVKDEIFLNRLAELILVISPGDIHSCQVKLDVLKVLAQVARDASESTKSQLQLLLGGVSEWFDEFVKSLDMNESGVPVDISFHRYMVLLLARVFDYELKTEDVLELTNYSRSTALLTAISLLGDSTDKHKNELPLILQICRLLRGFTIPNSYFSQIDKINGSSSSSRQEFDIEKEEEFKENNGKLSGVNIKEFCSVISSLLSLTMTSGLVERLSNSVSQAIFGVKLTNNNTQNDDGGVGGGSRVRMLDSEEHAAVIAFNTFLQNLYLYGEGSSVIGYQKHLLEETTLIPKLILPYLESCVLEARLLDSESTQSTPRRNYPSPLASSSSPTTPRSVVKQPSLLALGVSTSLKSLIMTTFRATKKVTENILINLNPTNSLLRSAPMLLDHHPELLALLCLLNVNMNSMDAHIADKSGRSSGSLYNGGGDGDGGGGGGSAMVEEDVLVGYKANALIRDISFSYSNLSHSGKKVVFSYLVSDKHGLPVSRDLRSYQALLSSLQQEERLGHADSSANSRRKKQNKIHIRTRGAKGEDSGDDEDSDDSDDIGRAEAKSAVNERLQKYKSSQNSPNCEINPASNHNEEAIGDEKRQQQQQHNSVLSTPVKHSEPKSYGHEDRRRPQHNEDQKTEFRLLGNLPSLSSPLSPNAAFDLSLPTTKRQIFSSPPSSSSSAYQSPPLKSSDRSHQQANTADIHRPSSSSSASSSSSLMNVGGAPPALCCCINGHVMKDPARAPSGKVFEYSTIKLWLQTRGSVCPCTGQPLKEADLVLDNNLRIEIMRWQIQRLSKSDITQNDQDDDIYDF